MTNTYSRISFTDVARRYNQINAIPLEASRRLGQSIADLNPDKGTVLDMGCGAGRISLPTATAGVNVLGLEIDRAMLHEAVRITAGLSFEGVHGNVVHLPLADNSISVVLSINVLHLVPAWEQVLDEAIRVLKSGGLFVQGRDWLDPDSCAGQLRSQLRRTVMRLMPGLRPTAAASPQVMAQALTDKGGMMGETIIATSWSIEQSPHDILMQMQARQHNETWMLDDATLTEAVRQLTAWANETWDDIYQLQTIHKRFLLMPTTGLV